MVDKNGIIKIFQFFLFYIVGIWGGDFFVRSICKFLNIPSKEKKGIMKAGKVIGFFERFIIITFFILSSYETIGLFFTAKSIIRLSNREESEYYLIGTMASFSWAIVWALFLKFIVKI
jgi:hypothetical protein